MGGETDAPAGSIRHEEPPGPRRARKAWVALRIVAAIVLGIYLHMLSQDPAVSERKAMQRGGVELLQTLQAGDDTYTLHYFRGGGRKNTVSKNGERVFDSSETATAGCIRLRRRDDGVVELECQHVDRLDAIYFPMP